MRTVTAIRIAAFSVCAFVGCASAEEVRVPLSGGGALVLTAPDGWRSSKQAVERSLPIRTMKETS